MNKLLSLMCALSFCHSAFANNDSSPPAWELEMEYLGGGKNEIDEPGRKDQHISYSLAKSKASYTHQLNEDNGLVVNIGYSHKEFDWKENPSFSETSFNNVNFRFGGYSTKIPNWVWRGAIGADIDADDFSFSHNAMYNGAMWGRYHVSKTVGFHIGFTGTTGLRRDKVFPILGIDYSPSKSWKIAFVFPVDLSVSYAINDKWSLAYSGRTFRSRHRLSQKEIVSKGIFDYRTFGTEASLNYQLEQFLAKVYVGSTYAGDLKVSDHRDKNPVFYKYNGSIYLGGNLTLKF